MYCLKCKEMFDNAKNLSGYIENCHRAALDRDTYFCEICVYNYDSTLSMNNDIERNHWPDLFNKLHVLK